MPVLVLGALLGLGVGSVLQLLFPGLDIDPKLFAVAGMASYFTGVVQAPLTGIVLLIEMTGTIRSYCPCLWPVLLRSSSPICWRSCLFTMH
jgi:chloride channel protein, CIC family